jgi:hypothetical protein
MRILRPKFTVRRLMALVAAVALGVVAYLRAVRPPTSSAGSSPIPFSARTSGTIGARIIATCATSTARPPSEARRSWCIEVAIVIVLPRGSQGGCPTRPIEDQAMRMPRITMRRLMIAVAISALIFWLFQPAHRSPYYEPRSELHETLADFCTGEEELI